MNEDVPSPIDLRSMKDAAEWARTAEHKRPWRPRFFAEIADRIATMPRVDRILDMGAGPGFLTEYLLRRFPDLEYVALDFSGAMHELARQRLGKLAKRVSFIERSFKDKDWSNGLGHFECIVTLQAVHELRHKRHAPTLHAQAGHVLTESGIYLMCDHFIGDGGMIDTDLYMTVDEHVSALRRAGFEKVEKLLVLESLALFSAE